jgi:hypothetical protein
MYGSPSTRHLLSLLWLVLAGFLFPSWMPEYFIYIMNMLMMYMILAIGLDIVMGWSGQFAFAHIAFFGIGIYGTALLNMRLGIPFLLGMPLAALLAGAVGYLIALPATQLRTVYLALATFAFSECAQWAFRTWESLTKGPDGLRMTAPQLFGYVVTNDRDAMPIIAIILGSIFVAISPPLLKVLPLSAVEKSLPTDCGTPAFLANDGLWATASMKLCCFLLVLGIVNLFFPQHFLDCSGLVNTQAKPNNGQDAGSQTYCWREPLHEVTYPKCNGSAVGNVFGVVCVHSHLNNSMPAGFC